MSFEQERSHADSSNYRFTLVGNWTVTLSINFSGAQLILSAITLWKEDFVATQWQVVLMFWAVMTIAFLVNVFGVCTKNLLACLS